MVCASSHDQVLKGIMPGAWQPCGTATMHQVYMYRITIDDPGHNTDNAVLCSGAAYVCVARGPDVRMHNAGYTRCPLGC